MVRVGENAYRIVSHPAVLAPRAAIPTVVRHRIDADGSASVMPAIKFSEIR
jgi:hypothetical protein